MPDSPFLDNRDRLFENSKGFVIYDKFPVSKGHYLIHLEPRYAGTIFKLEER